MNLNQHNFLSTLANAPAERLKPFVDSLLPDLGEIEVRVNRTGLVMVPGTDTVQGGNFHLGEVLVSEAQVRITMNDDIQGQGYGACLGRDLEQSLAIAVLDAALQCDQKTKEILDFVDTESALQAQADQSLLRQIEATRVEMETF